MNQAPELPGAERNPFASIAPYAPPKPGQNALWDEGQRLISAARSHPARLADHEWRFVDDMDGRLYVTAGQLRKYVAIFRKLAAIELGGAS